jgi:hypothetical protein
MPLNEAADYLEQIKLEFKSHHPDDNVYFIANRYNKITQDLKVEKE